MGQMDKLLTFTTRHESAPVILPRSNQANATEERSSSETQARVNRKSSRVADLRANFLSHGEGGRERQFKPLLVSLLGRKSNKSKRE